MIRLELAGAHTRVNSTLCSRCPHGPAGCCAAPPGVAWADLGRIAQLGGVGWLLEQIQAGHLRPGPRGLAMLRVAPDGGPDEGREGAARCVYLGPEGCSIPTDRRSATCNYYVCDDALAHGGEAEGDPAARAARAAHERLVDRYGCWDLEIGAEVRERWPEGPPWDAPFLAWLGEAYARLTRRDRRALRRLEP